MDRITGEWAGGEIESDRERVRRENQMIKIAHG